MKILGLVLGLLITAQAGQEVVHLCKGFAPENNRRIPVAKGFTQSAGGISEQEYNDDLDRVEKALGKDFVARGAVLKIDRLWESSEVNAYADRDGNNWLLEMHGGLARHPLMTKDGYAMVACHESGHHIGGAPHYRWTGDEMSNEGQADYFASLKCFRRLYTLKENRVWKSAVQVDPFIAQGCAEHFKGEALRLSCERASSAAVVLGKVLADLGQEEVPVIGHYDASVVAETEDSHPAAQCRVDTYYNAAICDRKVSEKVSDTDANVATCETANGYQYGYRPRCWYKPAVSDAGVSTNGLAQN
jgi:hypothetical protein